jgi:acyl carrier protein
MHPHRIVVLPELPLTANGKVDRRALRHLGASDATADRGLVEPRTPTERRLAEIWRDVLGLERVGVHDDFFELGGHSLRATQLLSRVRTAFDAELDLREVFEAATIEELAARLERLGRASGPQAAITGVARDLRRLGSD